MEHNIISVSGGKDSTALLLLAIERQPENMQAVFADTGHEHPQTYEYIQYLNDKVFPIRTIRADFSLEIARKAAFVAANWKPDLMADRPGAPGYWEYVGPVLKDADGEESEDWIQPDTPADPSDPYTPQKSMLWRWWPAKHPTPGMTSGEADEKISRTISGLIKPTGNPFLDLCIWKGRFPSTKARFCSEELKRNPIIEQVQLPLLDAGDDVISWQGVRADESLARRNLVEMEEKRTWTNGATLWNYRPILTWTAEECFAMHRNHGIKHNPLYEQGMGRVGCMPCIHARKDELLAISQRFPEEIERVAEWERIVSQVAKRSKSTFFAATELGGNNSDTVNLDDHGIWAKVEWSKTSRGKSNLDLFRTDSIEPGALCSSIYGLCE